MCHTTHYIYLYNFIDIIMFTYIHLLNETRSIICFVSYINIRKHVSLSTSLLFSFSLTSLPPFHPPLPHLSLSYLLVHLCTVVVMLQVIQSQWGWSLAHWHDRRPSLWHAPHCCSTQTLQQNICLFLNEKVGFIRPTKRYRKNSISCGALLSGTAQWTSGVGWSFDLLG